MLKKQNIKISGQKKSGSQNTLGKMVRDIITIAGLKTVEIAGYVAGDETQ